MGLIFKAEGSVLVNKATDGAGLDTTDRIDWANATDTGSILPTFGAGLTSSIELRISGAASIDVFGFVVGTVDEFVMTTGTSTVTTGNAAIGTAGTLTNASVMSVTLTGLDLFAGVGASLDEGGAGLADDTVDTDGAIGFAILGGSINFASVRPAGLGVGDLTAFTGIEIELAGAQLVGIDGLIFKAEGSVLVNKATDGAGLDTTDRIDWANATDTGSILPTFGAGLTSSIELRISGAASIDVFGFVVGTVDEFVMTTGTSTVTTGNAAIGTAGTLTNASVMSVTLTGLDLFAGVGASLDEGGAGLADDTVDTDGAIGFAILGGSINFASVRPAGLGVGDLTAFTGIEIELAGAQLVGIDGLIFKAEGSVLVNKATDGAGLDTTDRIDWANATDTGSILPTFGAGLTSSIELRISGAASIDVFGFVVGTVDEFVMTTGTSTVTTGNAAIGTAGTLTNASVMSVTLTGLDLFAGVGASLDEGGAGLADDTVDTDGAIGFAILGGSINFASVRPAGLGVGDLTAFTGIEIELAGAQLVGIDGLIFKAEGSVLVNKATDGAGLDTTDRIDWANATDTGSILPTFGAGLTSSIELRISGAASIDVFGFVVGTVDEFVMTTGTSTVTTGNAAIGTAGTLTNASVMSVTLTGLDLFAGVGASLDEGGAGLADDTVDTDGAIGFAILGGSINFASVRPAGLGVGDLTAFTGIEIELAGAQLVGIDGLIFKAEGSVLVNKATDGAGLDTTDRIDWANATDTGSILPTFGAGLTSSIELRISGAASIDVFGFVVGTVDEFVMTTGTSTVTTGNAAIGTAGTLTNASVMSVTLTGLDLFAGVGASLDEGGAGLADDTVDTDGAIGFAILGGSINFASVRPAGLGVGDLTAFTGIEIELAGAQLVGIDGLIFKAEGSVLVNKATDGAGLDTTDRIDWANATDTGSILPTFGAGLTSSIELRISGAASIDVFGFVVGTVDEFVMTTGTSTVTTGNAAIGTAGTLTNASVMSVTLTGLDLFAGVGASLDEGGAGLADDTVDTDGAIGFAILGGSINFASVRPAGLGCR